MARVVLFSIAGFLLSASQTRIQVLEQGEAQPSTWCST
jgi:hypothetical protein